MPEEKLWYDDSQFHWWNKRIKGIDSFKVKEDDFKNLAELIDNSDYSDNNFQVQHILPITLQIFAAKTQFELQKENSEFLPNINTFDDKYDYVFYTVGTSIAPILLSLSVIKPKHIILLIPDKIGDIPGTIIKHSRRPGDDFIQIKLYNIDGGLEQVIFDDTEIKKTIEDKIKQDTDTKRIAFDITGGKKSIGDIAFTVAALHSIDTFYVDFEHYDSNNPIPGTEFLRLMHNPIKEYLENLKVVFSKFPIYKNSLSIMQNLLVELLIEKNIFEENESNIIKPKGWVPQS